MKNVEKIVHKVQGRFGQITQKKVITPMIPVLIWLVASIVLFLIYINLSEVGRIWLVALIALAIVAYLVYQHRKRKKIPHVTIPIQPSTEKYVSVNRPTTAEIPIVPIVAERPYQGTPQTPGNYQPIRNPSPPKELRLDEVELSRFARNRIAEENYLQVSHAVFEIKKPSTELFVQLVKRMPILDDESMEKSRRADSGKKKTRIRREPRSTIYGEVVFILAAISVLLLPVILESITLPEQLTSLYAPIRESETFRLILLGIGAVLLLWSAFLFYRKWAYWHYWRLVLLQPNWEEGFAGGLIVIDKPPFLGGTVPLVGLQKINKCSISTGPTDAYERGIRSMLMQALRVRWMKADVPGHQKEKINLMGPINATSAARASRIINELSMTIHTKDRE